MNSENICLASQVIDIAEHNTYLELTSRVCYYDDINLNNMMLPYDDTSEEKAETLVNMPVQAKYKTNRKGEPTFGSHEMYKDANGNVVFNTSSIGTHTEVYIQDDTITTAKGEVKTLPCLFAKYRIWKRYKNVVDAVKRLFDLKKLFSSWEILTSSYEFKDGIKKITEYEFEANTLLGFEFAKPSYGASASALTIASEGSEMMIAEALSQDLLLENQEGGNAQDMADIKKKDVAEEVVDESKDTEIVNTSEETVKKETEEVSAENKDKTEETTGQTDVSQLTDRDLRGKISAACREKLGTYCWVTFHFPMEKEVWVEPDTRESELDYLRFTYEVSDDTITVSEPEEVKLTVDVRSIDTTVAELNTKIAEKDDSLVKASGVIAELKSEIATLKPFKKNFEVAEQKRIEEETKAKKDKLIASVVKSGLITKEEIMASKEFTGYVEALDGKSLNAIVGERLTASLEAEPEESTTVTETSHVQASANLDSVGDELVDKKAIMKRFLGGK